jgi:feruloyl esterase
MPCAAMKGTRTEAARIGLPTRGAVIDTAEVGDGICVLRGVITAADPAAPGISFQINLPEQWNGKALQVGGGAYDGTLVAAQTVWLLPDDRQPLALGYATFGSDGGHRGDGLDASFALNDEALENYGGAQLKKVRDVAFRMIERYYGKPARRLYFFGASQGGHEALIVAQRYFADYDGVISVMPAYDFTAKLMAGVQLGKVLYGEGGVWLAPEKLALIADSVLKSCDGLDGLQDGLIGAVAACRTHFDVETLRCAGRADACLSDGELATARALAARKTFPFAIGGLTDYAGWPLFEGAFTGPTGAALGRRPVTARPPTRDDAFLWIVADQAIRYMFTRDPAFDSLAFDPVRYAARVRQVSDIIDANSADLDGMRAHGGKLILEHGSIDMAMPAENTSDYYRRLTARYGAGTNDFVRYYTVPGFGHGDGAFQAVWDSLSALDAWVETGMPPSNPVVRDHAAGHRGRTRPLCDYPAWPRYRSGDPDRAGSFVCSER